MYAIANYCGYLTVTFLAFLGEVVLLALETFRSIFCGRIRWRLVVNHIFEVGYRSQLVVLVTGAFTGAVFTAQAFFQFRSLDMASAVGPVVSVATCRELGPVLTGP